MTIDGIEMNQKPARRHGADTEVHRRQRGKNLATLAALLGFVVLVYFVAMIRMSGGSFP
ncbi:hypothetical protein [Niveispirillum sp. SYP-B3756]|jgi:hypothetical protein|uniref:hypothetical protein n=1 Tax=Niveispirillum sp. SYP-B3756 TaxID=2662178 RepID=UPI001B3B8C75|nr:hypothetical protein [Niveispirillum sp. SYP-B3756]